MEQSTETAQIAEAIDEKSEKFYCLSRDFRQRCDFSLYELGSVTEEDAWEEIEETISETSTQDWLITAEEARTIKALLKDF